MARPGGQAVRWRPGRGEAMAGAGRPGRPGRRPRPIDGEPGGPAVLQGPRPRTDAGAGRRDPLLKIGRVFDWHVEYSEEPEMNLIRVTDAIIVNLDHVTDVRWIEDRGDG